MVARHNRAYYDFVGCDIKDDAVACGTTGCQQRFHVLCAHRVGQGATNTVCSGCLAQDDFASSMVVLQNVLDTRPEDDGRSSFIRLNEARDAALQAAGCLPHAPDEEVALVQETYAATRALLTTLEASIAHLELTGFHELQAAHSAALEAASSIGNPAYELALIDAIYTRQSSVLTAPVRGPGWLFSCVCRVQPTPARKQVCDYPKCRLGKLAMRTCKVDDCGKQHHHICAITAGQEELSTTCHGCQVPGLVHSP